MRLDPNSLWIELRQRKLRTPRIDDLPNFKQLGRIQFYLNAWVLNRIQFLNPFLEYDQSRYTVVQPEMLIYLHAINDRGIGAYFLEVLL